MEEADQELYQFVVIGAGPAGLTAVVNLLDNGISRIAWIDLSFSAGRLGEKYAQVPSNTKIQLFLDYVESSPTLSDLVKQAPRPNAYSKMETLERDRGDVLKYAADLMIMLTNELVGKHGEMLKRIQGHATSVNLVNQGGWIVAVDSPTGSLRASKIVLATGSEPVRPSTPTSNIPLIDLEIALSPSKLSNILQEEMDSENTSVAVIGSSHSAILVLKNLTDLSTKLKIFHLYRSELKFAEYKDGWTLYDNTGLKGIAADWARTIYPKLVENQRIIKYKIDKKEENLDFFFRDREEFAAKGFSKIVYAIGYRASQTLKIMVNGHERKLEKFDHLTGRFDDLPSLFGCGIAFPQRVVDPAGNVEMSVGIFKFMKFLKLVVPSWIQS